MCSTRSKTRVYLIGEPCKQILGGRLPSNRQVLQVLFSIYNDKRLSLRASAAIVVNETCGFWDKAYIPTQRKDKCVNKLLSLYGKWHKLFKHKNRESAAHKNSETVFLNELEKLFDIAAENALNVMTNKADKQFLINQRNGRHGVLLGISTLATRKQKAKLERMKAEADRKRKQEKQLASISAAINPNDIDSDDSTMEMNELVETECQISGASYPVNIDLDDSAIEMNDLVETETEMDVDVSSNELPSRGIFNFINERIVCALDKCKISDRDAVHLLVAVAEALGHDVEKLIINRTTLQRVRQLHRESIATKLKDGYKLNPNVPCTIHFDGKLLPTIHGKSKVDRLPVIVSNKNGDQLLGIPSIPNGTGQEISAAVVNVITEWGLQNNIQAICCDTTASNTGRSNGACAFLEQRLGRSLIMLPCRHHIYEIILKAVFDIKMGATSAPEVLLFKRFQAKWENLDVTKYRTALDDDDVNLSNISDEIERFCISQLKEKHSRADYAEFLKLALIFLGKAPPSGTSFRSPGAFHHARWMAKAIYCFKIYLFRDQFQLTARELKGIREICLFVVSLYIKVWFYAPLAAVAPNTDFNFLIDLYNYAKVDKDISNTALKKMCGHLWYLSEEAVALAFFDNSINVDVKAKMVQSLRSRPSEYVNTLHNRHIMQPKDVPSLKNETLARFVTKKTAEFFERFNISTEFMDYEPSAWPQHNSYIEGLQVVQRMQVVNDVSERKVKLMEEFNQLLTHDEEQKQFLLLTVDQYRQQYSSHLKSTLLQKK